MAGSPGEWISRLIAPMQGYGITLDRLRAEAGCVTRRRMCRLRIGNFIRPHRNSSFSRHGGRTSDRQSTILLYLITGKTNTRLNSQVLDRDRDQLPQVWAHPQVLAEAGLAPGEEALVESPYGSMRVRIQVDAQQRHDTFHQPGDMARAGGTQTS